jgi:hypothetical protein
VASKQIIGRCGLCGETSTLLESHFLPKGLYRLLRIVSRAKNPHPVRLAGSERDQSSRQATHHLLCPGCEKLFDHNGENWMLRNLYRGHGVFRLRDLIEKSTPLSDEPDDAIYSAAALPAGAVDQIVYFSCSVFWRASIRDWQVSGKKYEAIDLGPYQQQVREYLLAKATFPANATLTVILSKLRQAAIAFNFPDTVRLGTCHCHTLHVPGITFQLTLGKQMEEGTTLSCVLRSPWHPIFVSHSGDARVQRQVLRQMGKVAPPWAEYPLIEGVV